MMFRTIKDANDWSALNNRALVFKDGMFIGVLGRYSRTKGWNE